MQIITKKVTCSAGVNYIPYEFTDIPAEPSYLIAVNLIEIDTTAVPQQPQFDSGNVWLHDNGNGISLVSGWMKGGALMWHGKIPVYKPIKLQSVVYHARASYEMRLALIIAKKGEV